MVGLRKLSAAHEFEDGWLEYLTCITGGDLDRRLDLRDEELVVYVLVLFVVLLLAQIFLYYGWPKVVAIQTSFV